MGQIGIVGKAVRGFKGLSLRFRIAGGVLAGLVVLFSFFGFLALRTIDLSIDVALEDRLRLAQISAASVDELLEHTARQLERTAAFVAAGPTEEEEGQAAHVYALLSEFDRIVRLSPEGRVLWIVPPRADDAGCPCTEDAAVRAALGRTETSIVAPSRGILADGLIAILVTPLDGQDRSAGFLAGELRASHADVNLLSLPQNAGSVRSEIVDAAGYIVAASGTGELERPDEHVAILAPMIAGGRPGTTIHHVRNGAGHLLAPRPLGRAADPAPHGGCRANGLRRPGEPDRGLPGRRDRGAGPPLRRDARQAEGLPRGERPLGGGARTPCRRADTRGEGRNRELSALNPNRPPAPG